MIKNIHGAGGTLARPGGDYRKEGEGLREGESSPALSKYKLFKNFEREYPPPCIKNVRYVKKLTQEQSSRRP